MKLILKALVGGVVVPIFYLGMFASAGTIVEWTHGDDHPSLELLMMPLVWPMSVIDHLSTYFYQGNVFEDFPLIMILLSTALDFVAYALLSYGVLWWWEKRRRLA